MVRPVDPDSSAMNPHPNRTSSRSWHFSPSGTGRNAPTSLLGKLLAIVFSLVVFGLVLAFSLIFLAIGVVVGLLVWGYLKYRAASLKRALEQEGLDRDPARRPDGASPHGEMAGGRIIEGEARREDSPADGAGRPH